MTTATGCGKSILAIVEDALDLDDAAERAVFVARMCGGDRALREQVERLLALSDAPMTGLQTGHLAAAGGIEVPLPARIGPFRLLREIARGGMGAVVEAERDDGVFQQRVAIKLIRGDLTGDAMRRRFAEERRILARLQHPGVVRIIDGGEVAGQLWLAMDLISGEQVDAALDRRGANQRERLAAFEAVGEAVAYAHRQLVIHADIKPSNVLMDTAGQVHLLDFGIARLVVDNAEPSAGEIYPLTRGYAAPERAGGAAPTIAGDVFSLGMLLLVMLGGTVPSAISACVDGTHLPVGRLDGDLAAIVGKALAAASADRYPDVAALLADLRRLRAHVPVTARGDANWRYFAGKFVQRHRGGLVITALAAFVLICATAISTVQYLRAEQARSEADARFADARGTAHYLLFELIPTLENRPNSLRLRARIADVAQRYLDRLSSARQASDDVRLEAATGLWQLARYQASWGHPHLNQPQRAEANLAKAEALASRLPGGAAHVLRARIGIDRVLIATTIQTDLAKAEALATTMVASFGAAGVAAAGDGDPGLRLDADAALAELRGWQARYPDEIAIADRALARLPERNTRDALLQRNRFLRFKAEAQFYLDRKADATATYHDALAQIEHAHAAWPNDNYLLSRLSVAHWEVGSTLLDTQRLAQAAPLLEAAVNEAGRALAFDPEDLGARRSLRVARNTMAQLLSASGRSEQALAVLRQSLETDRQAMLAHADNAQLARDYVFDHDLLGEALSIAGRVRDACASDREALSLHADLARRGMQAGYDATNNIKLVKARIVKNCAD